MSDTARSVGSFLLRAFPTARASVSDASRSFSIFAAANSLQFCSQTAQASESYTVWDPCLSAVAHALSAARRDCAKFFATASLNFTSARPPVDDRTAWSESNEFVAKSLSDTSASIESWKLQSRPAQVPSQMHVPSRPQDP